VNGVIGAIRWHDATVYFGHGQNQIGLTTHFGCHGNRVGRSPVTGKPVHGVFCPCRVRPSERKKKKTHVDSSNKPGDLNGNTSCRKERKKRLRGREKVRGVIAHPITCSTRAQDVLWRERISTWRSNSRRRTETVTVRRRRRGVIKNPHARNSSLASRGGHGWRSISRAIPDANLFLHVIALRSSSAFLFSSTRTPSSSTHTVHRVPPCFPGLHFALKATASLGRQIACTRTRETNRLSLVVATAHTNANAVRTPRLACHPRRGFLRASQCQSSRENCGAVSFAENS